MGWGGFGSTFRPLYNIIRTLVCSAGTELGGEDRCRLCFREDRQADCRGTCMSVIPSRPQHRRLQDDSAQRFPAAGERHRGGCGQSYGERQALAAVPSAGRY